MGVLNVFVGSNVLSDAIAHFAAELTNLEEKCGHLQGQSSTLQAEQQSLLQQLREIETNKAAYAHKRRQIEELQGMDAAFVYRTNH